MQNPIWLAPEVMLSEAYTEKADVYSFGIICWEIAARAVFLQSMRFMSQIEAHVKVEAAESLSRRLITVITAPDGLASIHGLQEGGREPIPPDTPPEFRTAIEAGWAQVQIL